MRTSGKAKIFKDLLVTKGYFTSKGNDFDHNTSPGTFLGSFFEKFCATTSRPIRIVMRLSDLPSHSVNYRYNL